MHGVTAQMMLSLTSISFLSGKETRLCSVWKKEETKTCVMSSFSGFPAGQMKEDEMGE